MNRFGQRSQGRHYPKPGRPAVLGDPMMKTAAETMRQRVFEVRREKEEDRGGGDDQPKRASYKCAMESAAQAFA